RCAVPESPDSEIGPLTARPNPITAPSCILVTSAPRADRRYLAADWKGGPFDTFSTMVRLIAPAAIRRPAAAAISIAHWRWRRSMLTRPQSPTRRRVAACSATGGPVSCGDQPVAHGARPGRVAGLVDHLEHRARPRPVQIPGRSQRPLQV